MKAAPSFIEPLEARIAPATLVSATKVTFQDVDGDQVTVSSSLPIFEASQINAIFQFDTGSVNGDNTVGQQLQLLDLGGVAGAAGANITITAKRDATLGGNGLVNVGFVDAGGIDLNTLTISGDLGRIEVGTATVDTKAINVLTVQSLGVLGTSTQQGGGNLNSVITGGIGLLNVRGDIQDAYFRVVGNAVGLNITGSVIGGAAANSGRIEVVGNAGAIKIGQDLVGGTGTDSAHIFLTGSLGGISVGGSLIGDGAFSARIRSGGDMGAVVILGDVVGGSGEESAEIFSRGIIKSVLIKGSVFGGEGEYSAAIRTFETGDNLGPVKIMRDLHGGGGDNSAIIQSAASLNSVEVAGSVIGGDGSNSAAIRAEDGNAGAIKVGRDVLGGIGGGSAAIQATGNIASVTVGGSVVGNQISTNSSNAMIAAGVEVGPVKIGLNLAGGLGENSGQIGSGGSLASVTIGGSLIGGGGVDTGLIVANNGDIGAIKIGGDVRGGHEAVASRSGHIAAYSGGVASIAIGGSLIGGASADSGSIISDGAVGTIKIGRSIVGGSGSAAGSIYVSNFDPTGVKSLSVGGSIVGGSNMQTGYVFSSRGISSTFTVGGDIRGSSGNESGCVVSSGNTSSVKIGGSIIGGSGSYSGMLEVDGNVGKIDIRGSLIGGDAGATDLQSTGYLFAYHVGTLSISGSIIAGRELGAGVLTDSGAIRMEDDIGTLIVKKSIVGNSTNRVLITTEGQTTQGTTSDLAFGKITIGGSVHFADILAGYEGTQLLMPNNSDAQIGKVTVGGNWVASNLVAGVNPINGVFGDGNDIGFVSVADNPNIVSKIAGILIKGAVIGTTGGTDSFGFESQQIVSFKIGTTNFPLETGASSPSDLAGYSVAPTGDVLLREVI